MQVAHYFILKNELRMFSQLVFFCEKIYQVFGKSEHRVRKKSKSRTLLKKKLSIRIRDRDIFTLNLH